MGGKFHLKLNTGTRPIANKYREGKMKSTLKRESKGREAVKMEPFEASNGVRIFSFMAQLCRVSKQFKAFGARSFELDMGRIFLHSVSTSV